MRSGAGPTHPFILGGGKIVFIGIDKLFEGANGIESNGVVAVGMHATSQQGSLARLFNADHQIQILIQDSGISSRDGAEFGLAVEAIRKTGNNEHENKG